MRANFKGNRLHKKFKGESFFQNLIKQMIVFKLNRVEMINSIFYCLWRIQHIWSEHPFYLQMLVCFHEKIYDLYSWWLSRSRICLQCRRHRRHEFGSGRTPGEGNGTPPPSILAWKSHGQRSLVSPWGCKESYTTGGLSMLAMELYRRDWSQRDC